MDAASLPEDGEGNKLSNKSAVSVANLANSGTMDVWWLVDDGGLTVLIAHLLALDK